MEVELASDSVGPRYLNYSLFSPRSPFFSWLFLSFSWSCSLLLQTDVLYVVEELHNLASLTQQDEREEKLSPLASESSHPKRVLVFNWIQCLFWAFGPITVTREKEYSLQSTSTLLP